MPLPPCEPVSYTPPPVPPSLRPFPKLPVWVRVELWGGGGPGLSEAPPFLICQLQSPRRQLWDGDLLPRIDSHLISLWHSAESTYNSNSFCNTQGPVGLSFEKVKEVGRQIMRHWVRLEEGMSEG